MLVTLVMPKMQKPERKNRITSYNSLTSSEHLQGQLYFTLEEKQVLNAEERQILKMCRDSQNEHHEKICLRGSLPGKC